MVLHALDPVSQDAIPVQEHRGALKVEVGDTTNDKVSVTSTFGIAVYADTLPTPTLDIADSRNGWLYTKIAANTDKFNYYSYGAASSSHQYTLGDIVTLNFVGSVDNFLGGTSLPFIIVYSKPTGVGDAGVFYHSKRTFGCNMVVPNNIVGGEPCNWFHGRKPNLKNHNRFIELTTTTVEGDNLDTEEILFISVHSDSSSGVGTQILLTSIGYNLKDEIKRNIMLV
tara:strand:- start:1 stop:678 length:678 start_codon:yes stop_codon:yes gene_type:complete